MAEGLTQRELDRKIKEADAKIEKYKGYIAKLNEDKKDWRAQKRRLAAKAAGGKSTSTRKTTAAAKKTTTTKKTTAAKKTTTAKKAATPRKSTAKQPSLLEGVLAEVKKAGIDPGDLLGSILGRKEE